MLLHHPDRNAGVDAQEMAQRLNRAYEVLREPERRAAYDWELSGEPGEPPGGAEQGRGGPFSRSVWLAGAGGVVAIAVIVIAIVLATRGGAPDGTDQTTQVVAPVPTPNLTPPINPGTAAATEDSVTPPATPTASFLFESGEAFIGNGDFVQAIEEFTRAINLFPGYGFGYQVRGILIFSLPNTRRLSRITTQQ